MQAKKNSVIREQWQTIIAEAERHPVSVKAYCRENGINPPNLYAMRSKLRRQQQEAGSFARAEVVDPSPRLPDAKWVATFLRAFLGGVQ